MDTGDDYYTSKAQQIDALCNEFPRTNQMRRLAELLRQMNDEQCAASVDNLTHHGLFTPTIANLIHSASIDPEMDTT